MQYVFDFPAAGTYYVWLRGLAISGGNSLHVGLNGVVPTLGLNVAKTVASSFGWFRDGCGIEVPSAGEHTLNIYMREDGLPAGPNRPKRRHPVLADRRRPGGHRAQRSAVVAIDISILFPVASQGVSGQVTLEAEVVSLTPDQVDWRVDGTLLTSTLTADQDGIWRATLDSTTISEGVHYIRAEAVVSSTVEQQHEIAVAVDNDGPATGHTEVPDTVRASIDAAGGGQAGGG